MEGRGLSVHQHESATAIRMMGERYNHPVLAMNAKNDELPHWHWSMEASPVPASYIAALTRALRLGKYPDPKIPVPGRENRDG